MLFYSSWGGGQNGLGGIFSVFFGEGGGGEQWEKVCLIGG